jgi:hypothetical protein
VQTQPRQQRLSKAARGGGCLAVNSCRDPSLASAQFFGLAVDSEGKLMQNLIQSIVAQSPHFVFAGAQWRVIEAFLKFLTSPGGNANLCKIRKVE